jgi:hypothetical protein
MLRYQLEVVIALNVSAALSALFLYLTRPKEGNIQLPVHARDTAETYSDGDPFDVTTAEDVLEGYPLDEEQFWAKVQYLLTCI